MMIAKNYSASLYAEALQALYKRTPKNHLKFSKIQEEYYQIAAGNIGEEAVMKVIEQLDLPYNFYIFHDVLLDSETLFQMDILIITQYYAIILEVKNIKGEITFTDQQMIRTLATKETHAFDNPFLQLEEYEIQLKRLFQANHISLPVFSAVVFPFSSSIIKDPPRNKTILFRRGIKPYIRKLKASPCILSPAQLENLKYLLLKENIDFHPFPLTNHFDINPSSLRKGVECLHCGLIGMKKVIRNWYCPKCKSSHRYAHESALKDYFLIYKSTISNRECQQYLQLNNKYEATKILNNPMLIKTGQSRSRKYTMNFDK
ncbi:nuclease-related domain-containing protein [Psychrobacillus sp. NPDC093180]|uniref:nuclease-related domain-containing protein n=1 Tax=Psychrobacillus sp. NPDC093180 TaxID=3364489 RepID=UPI0037F61008